MAIDRREVREPFDYSDGGIAVAGIRDEVEYRITCDRCERVTSWSTTPPTMGRERYGHLTFFQPPHEDFYQTPTGDQLCNACFKAGPILPLQNGSRWWSRERPRHVVQIVSSDNQQVAFDVLYHPMMIDKPRRESQRHGLDLRQFNLLYITPKPDEMEQKAGRIWLYIEDQQEVVLRRWADLVLVESVDGGPGGPWSQPEFLQKFIPLAGRRGRTWLERILGHDLV